jgi:hypothetical protein
MDNKDGRALREPALVSDQAPSGLDPSGFDPARFANELRRRSQQFENQPFRNFVAPIMAAALLEVADAIERATAAPSPEPAPKPQEPVNCTHVLRAEGKAYPRTCQRCGLGPCPFYEKNGTPKNVGGKP